MHRLMWEAEAHVFGEMQKIHEYPYVRMMEWAEGGVKSYFRQGRMPMSAIELEVVMRDLWDQMKEIGVILEYRL